MTGRGLLRMLPAVLLLAGMTAATAEAGHHHRRARGCTTASSPQWFHFTSAGGEYVPFTHRTAAAPAAVPYEPRFQPARYGTTRVIPSRETFQPALYTR